MSNNKTNNGKKKWSWYPIATIFITLLGSVSGYYIGSTSTETDIRFRLFEFVYDKSSQYAAELKDAMSFVNILYPDEANEIWDVLLTRALESSGEKIYSPEGTYRIQTVNFLVVLHSRYPEKIIDLCVNLIPEDKNEWPPMISIVSAFYYIGNWEGTQEQFDKFQTLKESKFYGEEGNNIKRYFDSAESKFRLKME